MKLETTYIIPAQNHATILRRSWENKALSVMNTRGANGVMMQNKKGHRKKSPKRTLPAYTCANPGTAKERSFNVLVRLLCVS